MPGPGRTRHELFNGENYVGDVAASDATREFLKDPMTSIRKASYEGTLQALNERGVTGHRTRHI